MTTNPRTDSIWPVELSLFNWAVSQFVSSRIGIAQRWARSPGPIPQFLLREHDHASMLLFRLEKGVSVVERSVFRDEMLVVIVLPFISYSSNGSLVNDAQSWRVGRIHWNWQLTRGMIDAGRQFVFKERGSCPSLFHKNAPARSVLRSLIHFELLHSSSCAAFLGHVDGMNSHDWQPIAANPFIHPLWRWMNVRNQQYLWLRHALLSEKNAI